VKTKFSRRYHDAESLREVLRKIAKAMRNLGREWKLEEVRLSTRLKR